MLDDALALLICPHCGDELDQDDAGPATTLLCSRGHTFDVARQGYVSLLPGSAGRIVGDSAEMVTARADFLDRGHYDAVADALAAVVVGPRVVDVGTGTGFYLARALDHLRADGVAEAVGIGVDVSKSAARRAARAHPRLVSVVADVWDRLPVRTGAVDSVLSVFSPRNPAELRRILAPTGRLIVVTPTERHLGELVAALDLIGVDERKPQRLGASLSGLFERVERRALDYTVDLTHDEVAAVVDMGPSARHSTAADRRARIEASAEPVRVTVSVVVAVYEPLSGQADAAV